MFRVPAGVKTRDPSDETQGPIQKGFPIKSVRVRSTKSICNQTLMISVHLSQKIIREVLRQGLLALGTIMCVILHMNSPQNDQISHKTEPRN